MVQAGMCEEGTQTSLGPLIHIRKYFNILKYLKKIYKSNPGWRDFFFFFLNKTGNPEAIEEKMTDLNKYKF